MDCDGTKEHSVEPPAFNGQYTYLCKPRLFSVILCRHSGQCLNIVYNVFAVSPKDIHHPPAASVEQTLLVKLMLSMATTMSHDPMGTNEI